MNARPSFREAFLFWLKLGFISFGGPTGQIAVMHAELVETRRWISNDRFLHALNFCMLLPGPEATQLATYIGWSLHGVRGGIVAGVLFVLPSMFILWALSLVYVRFGTLPWVSGIFEGLKPAVVAIVAVALIRIGQKALKNWVMWALAGAAFVGIYFFKVPFPAIVFGALAIGSVCSRVFPGEDAAEEKAEIQPTGGSVFKTLAIGILIWFAPLVSLAVWLGSEHTLVREGIFFSKAAMVTFGGAYAVLPYVSQQAVETYGWLNATQMLDGLGLAETTPGPLIMVLQFVGFMGGYNHPGTLSPMLAATLGAFITTWTTFVPCFIWILVGAPHIERLRGKERINSALKAVTAAVVGVILNLAIWFGGHVLFADGTDLNWFGIAVAAVAFAGMWKWKWDVALVAVGAGLAGLAYHLVR